MAYSWPGFLTEHFWNEQLRTAASLRYPRINLPVSFSAFYLHQLIAMLPGSLALPAAVLISMRGKFQIQGPGREVVQLLIVTFFLEVISLCFSSRFTYYGISSWGLAAGFFALPWRDDPFWSRLGPRICLLLPSLLILAAAVGYLGMAFTYAHHPPTPPTEGIRKSELISLFILSPKFFRGPLAGCRMPRQFTFDRGRYNDLVLV